MMLVLVTVTLETVDVLVVELYALTIVVVVKVSENSIWQHLSVVGITSVEFHEYCVVV